MSLAFQQAGRFVKEMIRVEQKSVWKWYDPLRSANNLSTANLKIRGEWESVKLLILTSENQSFNVKKLLESYMIPHIVWAASSQIVTRSPGEHFLEVIVVCTFLNTTRRIPKRKPIFNTVKQSVPRNYSPSRRLARRNFSINIRKRGGRKGWIHNLRHAIRLRKLKLYKLVREWYACTHIHVCTYFITICVCVVGTYPPVLTYSRLRCAFTTASPRPLSGCYFSKWLRGGRTGLRVVIHILVCNFGTFAMHASTRTKERTHSWASM